MSTQTVPYSHKRGATHDDVTYLTDATDRGVTWVEGTGNFRTLITLQNLEQSWFFTEVKTTYAYSDIKQVRASVRRNHYDKQSYVKYEVWHPSGWQLKHIMGIEGTPAESINYATPLYMLDTELFRRTADIVWDIAKSLGDL